jgi:isobutyryl-CoA dehydrogenase
MLSRITRLQSLRGAVKTGLMSGLSASVPRRNISFLINSQGLDDDQTMIQEMAYKFAAEELEPHAAKWDMEKIFPIDTIKSAADLGFGGIYVREENGGCGLGRLEASLIFEALSSGCAGTSAYISIHNMCAWMIDTYGSKDQIDKFLP